MGVYKIKELSNREDSKLFLELPVKLYKNNRNWIRPLDKDIDKIFDKNINPLFANGECQRWLLFNNNDEIVGRIAAFIDYANYNTSGIPTGGMGFFECINDYKAAEQLFNTVAQWLKERGMEAMDGPINFGSRHEWWGLLVKGDYEPNYCMPYNHNYYVNFFERYGFKTYFKQYTYKTHLVESTLSNIILWKAERLLKNKEYKVINFDTGNPDKMMDDFIVIYNEAWLGDIPGVEKMSQLECKKMYKEIKSVLDPRLIYFAYHNNRPIGFFIMVPEMNYLIRKANGKINIWNKLKLYWHKRNNPPRKALGLIFGIVPDFQSKGVEAILIKAFSDIAFTEGFQYETLEMNWIGDFNPRMMHVMEYIGAEIYKTHITYRKLFDYERKVERCPIIS